MHPNVGAISRPYKSNEKNDKKISRQDNIRLLGLNSMPSLEGQNDLKDYAYNTYKIISLTPYQKHR